MKPLSQFINRIFTKAAKRPLLAVLVLLLILALLIATTIFIVMRIGQTPTQVQTHIQNADQDGGSDLEIDEKAVSIGYNPVNIRGEQVGIKIPGYSSLSMPSGNRLRVALLNPEDNPCYFVFEIVLKDTEEVLYTSKHVPPGTAVMEQILSRTLDPGSYDVLISISTISLADHHAPMNSADVEVTLNVH